MPNNAGRRTTRVRRPPSVYTLVNGVETPIKDLTDLDEIIYMIKRINVQDPVWHPDRRESKIDHLLIETLDK